MSYSNILKSFQNSVNKVKKSHQKLLPKPKGHLTVQMDELWSFVDDRGHEQWVWLTLDVVTHEIVGCCLGDRQYVSLWSTIICVQLLLIEI